MTDANANHDAATMFLKAWEAAGKPPVKKLVYPKFGQGRDRVLFKHSEIRLAADLDPDLYRTTFRDNGEDVVLGWSWGNPSLDYVESGSAELYFDRANPIRRGRSDD